LILGQLENGRMKLDESIGETGLAAYQVSAAMTMLELKGLVVHEAAHFSLAAKRERTQATEPIKQDELPEPTKPQGVVLNNLPPRSDSYAPGSMMDYLSKLPRSTEPTKPKGVVLNNLPPRSDSYAPGSMLDYLSKLPQ